MTYRLLSLAGLGLLVLICGCAPQHVTKGQRKVTAEQALSAASNLGKKLGYDVQQMEVVLDETNSEWNRWLASGPHDDFTTRLLRKLEGHDYWAIMLWPKRPQFGGDLTVFVDKNTGKILTYFRGQ